METDSDSPVRELEELECWEFLRSHELGRLAFRLLDELYITPVNYAVDGTRLLFRTAPGNKLFGVQLGAPIAFEVDEVLGDTALSVVVRGRARQLPESEQGRADSAALFSWVPTPKYEVVEIAPEEVTGRSVQVDRAWQGVTL